MVVQLKGLLGKTNRPIVVNGKLLTSGRSPITACLQNYHVTFNVAGTQNEIPSDVADAMITSYLLEFREKYDSVLAGTNIVTDGVEADVDSFTGAVIIETPSYKRLLEQDMHDLRHQFNQKVTALAHDFIVDYTSNWFDNYLCLFNRRIAAQHMPINVRSHFVSGLYQPLVVGTSKLPSPLSYGCNEWFLNILHNDEEYLETDTGSNRKLNLSCIAMCDIAKAFNTPVVFELDRKVWMLMVELLLLSKLDDAASSMMVRRYQHLFQKAVYDPLQNSRSEGRILTEDQKRDAVHRSSAQLFSAMMNYATKLNTQLATL